MGEGGVPGRKRTRWTIGLMITFAALVYFRRAKTVDSKKGIIYKCHIMTNRLWIWPQNRRRPIADHPPDAIRLCCKQISQKSHLGDQSDCPFAHFQCRCRNAIKWLYVKPLFADSTHANISATWRSERCTPNRPSGCTRPCVTICKTGVSRTISVSHHRHTRSVSNPWCHLPAKLSAQHPRRICHKTNLRPHSLSSTDLHNSVWYPMLAIDCSPLSNHTVVTCLNLKPFHRFTVLDHFS